MPVSKPTVFFSHSSRDREVVQRLQRFVAERTGRAVELFVSSDGQSIPGGHNWSARVHEALAGAQLMFVFVSPQSLDSRWIYFEAGYGYRGDIAVVPLGILGVALDRIPAPLNILQGFEIRSPDGLANVIDRINRTFDFGFDTRVSDADYARIFAEAAPGDAPELDAVTAVVLVLEATERDGGEWGARLGAVADALRSRGIAATASPDGTGCFGEGFQIGVYVHPIVSVDPWVYAGFAAALPDVVAALRVPPETPARLSIAFAPERVLPVPPLRESLLLGRVGVASTGDRTFVHDGTRFEFAERGQVPVDDAGRDVVIHTTAGAAAAVPVLAIARKVWEAGLIAPTARGAAPR